MERAGKWYDRAKSEVYDDARGLVDSVTGPPRKLAESVKDRVASAYEAAKDAAEGAYETVSMGGRRRGSKAGLEHAADKGGEWAGDAWTKSSRAARSAWESGSRGWHGERDNADQWPRHRRSSRLQPAGWVKSMLWPMPSVRVPGRRPSATATR